MKNGIFLGIDGGGTHTRVVAVNMYGNVLSYVESGASSLNKVLHKSCLSGHLLRSNLPCAIFHSTGSCESELLGHTQIMS